MQVRGQMYKYYRFIESTGFFEEVRLLSKNTDIVFAGLSAGAAVSQFAALDYKRIRGVYLYGLQKIGNDAFQRHYEAKRGAVTTSWWNKFDPWPVVPADNSLAPALFAQLPDQTVLPTMRMLDMRFWWRVNPTTNACDRMTADLATPCGRAGDTTCTLDTDDHRPADYFNNIQACVNAHFPNNRCLNDLEVLSLP
jgi:hypothetical protein